MPCALRCYFSHLCFSLAYDYFTIDSKPFVVAMYNNNNNNIVKQMK